VAVVSDGPDGDGDGVELHIINAKSGRMRKVSAPSETTGTIRLGHNDPDFSPDGKRIAFTYNENDGTEGDPRIGILTCRSKSNCTNGKVKLLKSGYANPSWSPSGALLAVETTDERGRDIAIITSKGGFERVQLTNDGNSFAPEFSPNGDQIAYLKRDGLNIDVRIMSLEIDDKGKISLVDDRPVTSDGEVDGESGLSWYIPRSERSRSVDAGEPVDESDDAGADDEDLLEGAPPPPSTS
jgi:Tol biopolymer transport system component